jgi:hypothetical protein
MDANTRDTLVGFAQAMAKQIVKHLDGLESAKLLENMLVATSIQAESDQAEKAFRADHSATSYGEKLREEIEHLGIIGADREIFRINFDRCSDYYETEIRQLKAKLKQCAASGWRLPKRDDKVRLTRVHESVKDIWKVGYVIDVHELMMLKSPAREEATLHVKTTYPTTGQPFTFALEDVEPVNIVDQETVEAFISGKAVIG